VFGYYLSLALRSLRRNIILSALMIAAIGVGIGGSMTMLTIFRAASGDPIPLKSGQLFVPQIDVYGPAVKSISGNDLPINLTYADATALMSAHAAHRQAAMYETELVVTPPDTQLYPFQVAVRATYSDLFPMFDVPFEYGGPWSATEDNTHAAVVVISRALNDRVFNGSDSVGRTLAVGGMLYRVIGVLDHWHPIPRFYDLGILGNSLGVGIPEDVLLPFTDAIDQQSPVTESLGCGSKATDATWGGLLRSDCVWIQFWVELPTEAAVRRYREFLRNYALTQHGDGRFSWTPRIALRSVRQWLIYNHVVPDSVSILVQVSFAFLLVCLMNAAGLMLAKFLARGANAGVRRALGARRGAIFAQCLVEAALLGFGGGLVGVVLTRLGLMVGALLMFGGSTGLLRLDGTEMLVAVALAITASLIAGLYPSWRAALVEPAWQLKAQ
jgi:putative ABC transport system permease protein